MVSTSCLFGMSKQQTGLRIDQVLFKQFQQLCASRNYARGEGASWELTNLILAVMWAQPYDKLGMDPRSFHQQSIGSSQLICRTVPRSLPDMGELAPNLSGLSQPVVRR